MFSLLTLKLKGSPIVSLQLALKLYIAACQDVDVKSSFSESGITAASQSLEAASDNIQQSKQGVAEPTPLVNDHLTIGDVTNDESDNQIVSSDAEGSSLADVEPEECQRLGNEVVKLQGSKCKAGARSKKQCPLCKQMVIHLPRHLRSKAHKWSGKKAKTAVQQFNIRKDYTYKSALTASTNTKRASCNIQVKTKPVKGAVRKLARDYHAPRPCPINTCSAVVKRMSPHLISVHHIQAKSRLLTHYLNKAARLTREARFEMPDSIDGEQDAFQDTTVVQSTAQTARLNEASAEANDLLTVNQVVNDPIDDDDQSADEGSAQNLMYSCQLFKKWLMSPDGGRKDLKTAQQHATQVKNILAQVNSDDSNEADCLLTKDIVSQKFLLTYAVDRRYRPGTIKSHLGSLLHLYDFWLLSATQPLSEIAKQEIASMKQTVKRWIASYRRESNQRTLEKMDSDLQKVITPEDMSKFKMSEPAVSAVKLLGSAAMNRNMPLSQQEYTLVRDYLLCEIVLSNANRPGVLAHMSKKHLLDARLVDDHYVVTVPDHKTSSVHGPAKIVLTQTLYSWLLVLINKIMPFLPRGSSGEADNAFLSWNGENLESCQIGRCFQALWKKAGLRDNVTCTLFRKTAVSTVHQQCPTMKANLADLMCHRQETANRCYRLVNREKTSVQASAKLSELLRQPAAVSSPAENIIELNIVEPALPTEIETLDQRVNRLIDDDGSSQIVPPSSSCRERLFCEADIRLLVNRCQQIITEGHVTSKRIREALEGSSDGVALLKKYSISQIMTRIAYERRKARVN